MIPILEFLALPVEEQAQYVWDNGIFLLNRKGDQINCLLYQVDNYYVEIWYHNAQNTILLILPFDDKNRLAADLQGLSLLETS